MSTYKEGVYGNLLDRAKKINKSTDFISRKIKDNLRSTAQKLFLFDVITDMNKFSYELVEEASLLLNSLSNASDELEKNRIMTDIDSFQKKYKNNIINLRLNS